MRHSYWSFSSFQPNIIKTSQGIKVMEPAQGCVWISASGGNNYMMKRVVSLAHNMPSGSPLHPHQILSNYLVQWELWLAQDFGFRGDNYITKIVRVVSCTRHAYWSSSSVLPNNIKICLRASKLWGAQRCFYGLMPCWSLYPPNLWVWG